MVVHGKVRWTSGKCMVAYGGHALSLNLKICARFSNSNITHVGARILKCGGKFEFKCWWEMAPVGKGHLCWQKTPKSIKGLGL